MFRPRGVFKGAAGSELTATVKVRGMYDVPPEPEGEAEEGAERSATK